MRGLRYAATALLLAATVATGGCAAQDATPESAAAATATTSGLPPTTGPSSGPAPSGSATDAGRPTTGASPRGSDSTATPATPSYSLSVPDLPTPQQRGIVEGGDVSWPQCPPGTGIPQKQGQGKPMPLGSAEFVVLGLTNGPGFHANPCLGSQVAWVEQRHLLAAAYSVISAPVDDDLARYGRTGPFDASTTAGRLANVGYQQARFNLATMRRAGLTSPIVWLDVEPVPDFDWPSDVRANAAVVQGAVRGYTDGGVRVGVYSIASLWQRVVGDLRLGLPEWRPAGGTSRAEALRRCGAGRMFQGGTAALAQWVEGDRDRDVTCPGTSTYLSLWFHQY
ncbi:hypothetical protein AB3X52_18840 [Nocardioides sp. DS6]|uniref:DUF1906 domain-containing protein n=1 Tax=Nocardioides eburneus TaxID=3231482 RepID=A0ABV3T3A0_9ACTN